MPELARYVRGFTKRVIDSGEAEISCVIGGSGEPILLLHGFPQNKAMWARVAAKLSDQYTVICADLRDYGDSSKPQGLADSSNYAFRAMVNDQVHVLRALGFDRTHIAGHDRGGRVAHLMALDHPEAVLSLTVMGIVPTHAMFAQLNKDVASLYWHWFFLSQSTPFPEMIIKANPDYFYETCLAGWGGMDLDALDQEVLSEYRRCWRDSHMIEASCCDYRAAAGIDLEHDSIDFGRKLTCSTLILYGSAGYLPRLFDLAAVWREYTLHLKTVPISGGHFFVDTHSDDVTSVLTKFIASISS
nr:alpha/beta hydrolase [Sphingomonas sp. CDS-1]